MRALVALAAVLTPRVASPAPAPGRAPAGEPATDLFWWIEVLSAGLWILAVTILVYCIYDCRQPDDAAETRVTADRSSATAVRRPAWRPRVALLRWLARTNG